VVNIPETVASSDSEQNEIPVVTPQSNDAPVADSDADGQLGSVSGGGGGGGQFGTVMLALLLLSGILRRRMQRVALPGVQS